MKLMVVNTKDENALNQALSVEGEILLIQDAVYFLNKDSVESMEFKDRNVYALDVDVEKRGIVNRLVQGVKLIDYEELVDLLFSGLTVVNL